MSEDMMVRRKVRYRNAFFSQQVSGQSPGKSEQLQRLTAIVELIRHRIQLKKSHLILLIASLCVLATSSGNI